MTVSYRVATARDAARMGEARRSGDWREGAEATVMERYLMGEHHPRDALVPRVALLAEQGADVVGFIAGHLTRRFGCTAELQWIYVAAAQRGKGVADVLLRHLATWCLGQGARHVCVNVAEENARARGFYARNGAQILRPHWMHWPDIGEVLDTRAPLTPPRAAV